MTYVAPETMAPPPPPIVPWRLPRWLDKRLPSVEHTVDLRKILRVAMHVAWLKSVYYSARGRGAFLVARGCRVRVHRSARVVISPGGFLFVGFEHATPAKPLVQLGRNARLFVNGTVQFNRGTRIFVNDGAVLSLGNRFVVNDMSTITCYDRITAEGESGGLGWSVNLTDTDAHVFIVNGRPGQVSAPIHLGRRVLIGSGATVLKGVTIGDNAVVASGSVVTKSVPARHLVGGNPAKVLAEDVDWLP